MNVAAPSDSPTHEQLGFVSTLGDDADDEQGNTRRQQELEYQMRQIRAEAERLRQQGKDSFARAYIRNAVMELLRQYEEERDADRRQRESERQQAIEDDRARHEELLKLIDQFKSPTEQQAEEDGEKDTEKECDSR